MAPKWRRRAGFPLAFWCEERHTQPGEALRDTSRLATGQGERSDALPPMELRV